MLLLNEKDKKLKGSEKNYRFILENANDLISVLNEKLEFELINENTHIRILGYSQDDMIGKTRFDLIHPDDFEYRVKSLRKAFKSGVGMAELRIKHEKGNYIWLEMRGKTFINEDGKKKILIISRDITERKHMELKLKKSEEKYRFISEEADDLISVFDDKFKTEFFNERTYSRILGYDIKKLKSQNFRTLLIHEADLEKTYKIFKTVLEKGSHINQLRLRHKTGKYMWFETKGRIFIDKNGNKKIILISRDISERKQAEERLKKSEKKYREAYNQEIFLSANRQKNV